MTLTQLPRLSANGRVSFGFGVWRETLDGPLGADPRLFQSDVFTLGGHHAKMPMTARARFITHCRRLPALRQRRRRKDVKQCIAAGRFDRGHIVDGLDLVVRFDLEPITEPCQSEEKGSDHENGPEHVAERRIAVICHPAILAHPANAGVSGFGPK